MRFPAQPIRMNCAPGRAGHGPLRGIFVIHGEEEPALAFPNLTRLHPQADVRVPQFAESVEL